MRRNSRLIVRRPDRRGVEDRARYFVGKQFIGLEDLESYRETVGAIGILFPGIETGVGRDGPTPEGVGLITPGPFIEIEKHDLGPRSSSFEQFSGFVAVPGFAADERMVFPRHFAAIVEPQAPAVGDADVFLDDAAFHFRNEGLTERFQRREFGREVGVLRLEMSFHRWVLSLPQPEVVIAPPDPVNRERMRSFFSDGGRAGEERGRGKSETHENEQESGLHGGDRTLFSTLRSGAGKW
jgi:hypothetical protein